MGTNYYYYNRPPCLECERPFDEDRIHIGKNSYGWRFALHVYPEDLKKPQNLDDWKTLLEISISEVRDGYGNLISKHDLLDVIENKTPPPSLDKLHQHDLDQYCIGHGSANYDLVIGDFS